MVEIEEGGQTYRVNKLDAFSQFHLSRKLAPIVPTLVPVYLRMAQEGEKALTDIMGTMQAIQPFAEALAEMEDESAEYVLATCLGAVQRKTTAGFVPIWSGKSKTCMFDDIDLGVMVKLSFNVITASLGPFIRGLLTSQQGQTEANQ